MPLSEGTLGADELGAADTAVQLAAAGAPRGGSGITSRERGGRTDSAAGCAEAGGASGCLASGFPGVEVGTELLPWEVG